MNFECCTLETMCLIVLLKFLCNTHLTMSMIVLFFHHFHWLVLSLFLKTFLILPPTTVLCIFHEDSSMQQSVNFTIQLTGGSAGTQAIATFTLHLQDKDPYFVVLLICWFFADMPCCIWLEHRALLCWLADLQSCCLASNFVDCWVCSAPEGRVCWRDCGVVPLAMWYALPEG